MITYIILLYYYCLFLCLFSLRRLLAWLEQLELRFKTIINPFFVKNELACERTIGNKWKLALSKNFMLYHYYKFFQWYSKTNCFYGLRWLYLIKECTFPVCIYLLKVSNENTRIIGEIYSKQTPKWCIAKLKQSSHIILVCP